MSTEVVEKPPRRTWTHPDVLRLADLVRSGKSSDEVALAFPSQSSKDVARKIESLGLGPKLSETQEKLVAHFVKSVGEGSHPRETARKAIRELRKFLG